MVQTVKVRVPMPASRRAKQFQPFDALKGFREAILAKEILITPRRELAADGIAELNTTLSHLQKGQVVTVVYYSAAEQNYVQITGNVAKVDPQFNRIEVGNLAIGFSEIVQIIYVN